MIIVTGGAGFIGSNLINFLENQNFQDIEDFVDEVSELSKK